MLRGRTTSRLRIIAALALLLLAGADLLAIDVFGQAGKPTTSSACSDTETHEDCFCCCRHVVFVPMAVAQPLLSVNCFADRGPALLESRSTPVPFHPPRA
jgi:hypothetical protein